MKIFTFWEPKAKMPAYVSLCLETWKKINNAEIIVLDFANLNQYVDISVYGSNLTTEWFSLPQIADAIRCLVLEKHGGIWLDADTIIIGNNINGIFESKFDVSFFGNKKGRNVHLAFIRSNKNSNLMKYWVKECKKRIANVPNIMKDSQFWAYLGNDIVNDYVRKHEEEIEILDVFKYKITPEKDIFKYYIAPTEAYVNYWFGSKYHCDNLSSEIILLHNSWTPIEFKSMSREKFLECECTLSNILSECLSLNFVKNYDYKDIIIQNLKKQISSLKKSYASDIQHLSKKTEAELYISTLYNDRVLIYIKYYLVKSIYHVFGLGGGKLHLLRKMVNMLRGYKRKLMQFCEID